MNSRAAEPPSTHVRTETGAKRKGHRPSLPLKFCLLVFAFSGPFWLIGAVSDVQLLPGLPLSALSAVCPLLAAMVLVHNESQRAGVVALLKRSFDFKRIPAKGWYAPTLLLMPGVSLAVYGLMRWGGSPVPAPQFPVASGACTPWLRGC